MYMREVGKHEARREMREGGGGEIGNWLCSMSIHLSVFKDQFRKRMKLL